MLCYISYQPSYPCSSISLALFLPTIVNHNLCLFATLDCRAFWNKLATLCINLIYVIVGTSVNEYHWAMDLPIGFDVMHSDKTGFE